MCVKCVNRCRPQCAHAITMNELALNNVISYHDMFGQSASHVACLPQRIAVYCDSLVCITL